MARTGRDITQKVCESTPLFLTFRWNILYFITSSWHWAPLKRHLLCPLCTLLSGIIHTDNILEPPLLQAEQYCSLIISSNNCTAQPGEGELVASQAHQSIDLPYKQTCAYYPSNAACSLPFCSSFSKIFHLPLTWKGWGSSLRRRPTHTSTEPQKIFPAVVSLSYSRVGRDPDSKVLVRSDLARLIIHFTSCLEEWFITKGVVISNCAWRDSLPPCCSARMMAAEVLTDVNFHFPHTDGGSLILQPCQGKFHAKYMLVIVETCIQWFHSPLNNCYLGWVMCLFPWSHGLIVWCHQSSCHLHPFQSVGYAGLCTCWHCLSANGHSVSLNILWQWSLRRDDFAYGMSLWKIL